VVAAELSFDGTFELQNGDADVLLRLRDGDILFQKERLLNLALECVPRHCRKIAWIDCDTLFGRPDWPALAGHQLDSVPLVHLFHERVDLAPDPDLTDFPSVDGAVSAVSSIHRIRALHEAAEDVIIPGSVGRRGTASGLAWAARRDMIAQHGFYDACIMGSGDQALVCAALGLFDHYSRYRSFGEAQTRHYLSWAEPFRNAVRGEIGWIPGTIYHLWHGDLKDRRYASRYPELARYGFDPYTDIRLSPSRCWRWNSEKPALHEFVKDYFYSRNEDGDRNAT
jgi:hypothetical protein